MAKAEDRKSTNGFPFPILFVCANSGYFKTNTVLLLVEWAFPIYYTFFWVSYYIFIYFSAVFLIPNFPLSLLFFSASCLLIFVILVFTILANFPLLSLTLSTKTALQRSMGFCEQINI